ETIQGVKSLKIAREKKRQKANKIEIEIQYMAKVGSEYLLIQQLEFKNSCALKNNEGFGLELNNAYDIMVDAASKQNAFKALKNKFYHENAKSTMRNKR
ncbi:9689_t:CDS:2, partial [Racocetra fulgida]